MARWKSPPLTFFYQTTATSGNTSRYLVAAKLYGTSTGKQNTRDVYSPRGTPTSFSTSDAATSPSPARPTHCAPGGRPRDLVRFPPCLRPTTRQGPARGGPPPRTCTSLPLSSGAVAEPGASWRQSDPVGVCAPGRRRAEGEAAVPSRRRCCPAAAIARCRCYGEGLCRCRRPLSTLEGRSSSVGGLGAVAALSRPRFPRCAAVAVDPRQQCQVFRSPAASLPGKQLRAFLVNPSRAVPVLERSLGRERPDLVVVINPAKHLCQEQP